MPLSFALTVAAKGTLLMLAAALLSVALRRASAASRHLLWQISLAGLLAVPLLAVLLPAWSIAPAPDVTVELFPTAAGSPAPPAPVAVRTPRWPAYAAWAWLAGALLLLARLAYGFARIHSIARQARIIRNQAWLALRDDVARVLGVCLHIPLLEARRAVVPMAWGLRRPVILLPPSAASWSPDKRRAVLLHEMAHIERGDCRSQLMAQVACALWWFHPLAWFAEHRLAVERERACDDRVLTAGARASEYAAHLLDVARSMKARREWALAAIAMARHPQISSRLTAILDGRLKRQAPQQTAAVFAAVALVCLVLPLAAMRAPTQSVAGLVYDPQGARVPESLVTLRNAETGAAVSVHSNEWGRFSFDNPAPGRYRLEVRRRGFALYRADFALARGAVLDHAANLRLGIIRDSLNVRGSL